MLNGTSEKTDKFKTKEDDVLGALQTVREELAVVSKRVGGLEQDNFTMQKQLELMVQAEERRKFLGTNSVKVPFGLVVKCRMYLSTKSQFGGS